MPGRKNNSPPSPETLAEARRRLAQRMIELRGEAGLSQRQAADRAGIDQSNWGRMEAEKTSPRLDSLLKIQYAFGLDSLESLLGRLPAQELLDTHQQGSG